MKARLLLVGLVLCLPSCGVETTGGPQVVIDTTMGKIKCELWPHKAPNTVKNFLKYVDDRHYDGMMFHMIIVDSKIETGKFLPGFIEKDTRDPIRSESNNGVANTRATLAASGDADPQGVTSKFFINVRDNPYFDKNKAKDGVGYTVFGHVIEGLAVCDELRRADVHHGKKQGHEYVPVEQILVKSIRRVETKK